MSHFSAQGEQSTSSEITALANLTALATSGAGEFIRKTGATTFENATASGGGVTVETPTGTVNGANTAFGVSAQPKWVVSDGITYFDGAGYTYAALIISMDIAPSSYIRAIV